MYNNYDQEARLRANASFLKTTRAHEQEVTVATSAINGLGVSLLCSVAQLGPKN